MMRVISSFVLAGALLVACGQPVVETPAEDTSVMEEAAEIAAPDLPAVDAALLSAPASAFIAIEPTELGVIAAPSIYDAIAPLITSEEHGEGASVHLTVVESGDTAVADVVRLDLPDDSVAGGHVRVEFLQSPEGWFPANAYRRSMCRRGAGAGQWTTEVCP